jgi:hypothetical protein
MEGDPAGATWVPWGDEVPDLRSRAAVSETNLPVWPLPLTRL